MQTMLENSSVIKYQSVAVEYFEEVEFSGKWDIKIRPGRVCEVQVEIKNDTLPKPRLKSEKGKQFFVANNQNEVTHAKISLPMLKKISALQGAKIYIQDYPADSIFVELKDSSSFTGKNNQFEHIFFKTSGEAAVEIIETMN